MCWKNPTDDIRLKLVVPKGFKHFMESGTKIFGRSRMTDEFSFLEIPENLKVDPMIRQGDKKWLYDEYLP